jgi:hypothetical protein
MSNDNTLEPEPVRRWALLLDNLNEAEFGGIMARKATVGVLER